MLSMKEINFTLHLEVTLFHKKNTACRVEHLILRALAIQASSPQNALARKFVSMGYVYTVEHTL